MNKEQLIAFEKDIEEKWNKGLIHCPVHFCGGNEVQLIGYFNEHVKPNDWILSTWRNHYHWLLATEDEQFLLNKILKENNSMHIIDLKRKFISTAIVGGNAAMAVGIAKAIKLNGGKEKVHCFIGDGGCDSGWFWEALRYARGNDLNIKFIIENNNRSVCTDIKTRWGEKDNLRLNLESMGYMKDEKIYYYEYIAQYPHCGTNTFVRFM